MQKTLLDLNDQDCVNKVALVLRNIQGIRTPLLDIVPKPTDSELKIDVLHFKQLLQKDIRDLDGKLTDVPGYEGRCFLIPYERKEEGLYLSIQLNRTCIGAAEKNAQQSSVYEKRAGIQNWQAEVLKNLHGKQLAFVLEPLPIPNLMSGNFEFHDDGATARLTIIEPVPFAILFKLRTPHDYTLTWYIDMAKREWVIVLKHERRKRVREDTDRPRDAKSVARNTD